MPYQIIDREIFLEHDDTTIYHSYNGQMVLHYHYVTNDAHGDEVEFDVRDLPTPTGMVDHRDIIHTAIDTGTLDTLLATCSPPDEAPTEWVDPETVLEYGDMLIQRGYDDDQYLFYSYQWTDNTGAVVQVDLRDLDLPSQFNADDTTQHLTILRYAIDHHLLTSEAGTII